MFDATSWEMAFPSFMEPEILVQQNQKSDFPLLLAGRAPRAKLSPEDKWVYLRSLAVRTNVSSGQSGQNQVPGVSMEVALASAPAYLQQLRAQYDHHQTAMAARWNTSIVEASRLAMQQGHYQMLRGKTLFGELPANGEGLLNATGATSINLPVDPYGNSTFSTYDNNAMGLFILGIVAALKNRMYQMGMPTRVAVLGPQQDVSRWQYQGIVQLTSYQRAGAGTATIAELVQDILKSNGDSIEWGYDDTLIGAGAGGTDAILFVVPEIKRPDTAGLSTNRFGAITNGFMDCTVQYVDTIAPFEFPCAMPGGATDVLSEMTATTGWAPRPEGVTVLSGAP